MAKTTHFKGQMRLRAGTSVKTVAKELFGPNGQNCPFSRSNEPQSSPWIFCSSKSPTSFLPKFYMNVR
ncbi:hypothetical protein H5410_044069 [Solanum commersonii]|uniref:Uncharacterized protein n=1 Tax=Solanum commersonii TaxID=4109 RepID=A0A9J5XYX7_SOLCO|nr:hypothetical protein H5410_044069 [Solanum commersonii]